MELSAGAILLGLSVLGRSAVTPRELSSCLGEVADGSGRDQVLGLQQRLMRNRPALVDRLAKLCVESDFVPIHCPDCSSSFRAHAWQIDSSPTCPICGTPVIVPYVVRPEGRSGTDLRRAAEREPAYATSGSAERFAHFDLVSRIGSGGAGTVYEAVNARSGRRVALKVLKFMPLETTGATWERLLREAAVATSVAHPNVVQVYDVALAEGRPFVEMELLPEGSLRDHVQRKGPLPAPRACRLMDEVLAGLSAAHRERVVHRDLKPGNILLDRHGHARITDFGLCKLLEDTTSTTTGKVIGSPHFMAPEQWRGEQIGPWTDVYAAGLLLHYLLTARLPFSGDNTLSIMYRHLHSTPPDPREWAPDTPAELCEIIRTAAARNPAERFDDAEEFRGALADIY